MAWFSRVRAPKPSPTTEESERLNVPGDLWTKCPGCSSMVYTKEIDENDMVCTKCNHHFRIAADRRIKMLCDRRSFEELDSDLRSNDPLSFKDNQRYKERLKKAEKKSGAVDAIRTGKAKINGVPVMLGIFDFSFMGGSMGRVVGNAIIKAANLAIEKKMFFNFNSFLRRCKNARRNILINSTSKNNYSNSKTQR